jgi:phospholipid transport system transporter-binding protein
MDARDAIRPQAIEFRAKVTEGDFLVRGEMTFATASQGLKRAAGSGRSVRFDLAGISRADSSGVGLMIEWLLVARSSGCQLRYSNIPTSLEAMIRVGGVEGMLPIDASAPTNKCNVKTINTETI